MEIGLTAHIGYDVIYREPGETESVNCPVCHANMNVERNAKGPGHFMQRGPGPVRDRFTCPNKAEKWHLQARAILVERSNSHSPTLRAMLLSDALDIVRAKKTS